MWGQVFLSCGHEDLHRPISGWPLAMKDYSEFGLPAVSHSSVCKHCYLAAIINRPDDIIFSEDEEKFYLNG